MGVSDLLGNDKWFLCPDYRVNDLCLFLYIIFELSQEADRNFSQLASVLIIQRSEKIPAVILEEESSWIPKLMEGSFCAIEQDDFLPISAHISSRIWFVEKRNRMQRLMYISSQMNKISCI